MSARYASVAVDRPTGFVREYTYLIPAGASVGRGDLVIAPFGGGAAQGIVCDLLDELPPEVPPERLREIAHIIAPRGLVGAPQMELARWMADYYKSDRYSALSLMTPRGVGPLIAAWVRRLEAPAATVAKLTDKERALLKHLPAAGAEVKRSALIRKFGLGGSAKVNNLVRKGMIEIEYRLKTAEIKAKTVQIVKLALGAAEAAARARAEVRNERSVALRLNVIEHLVDLAERDERVTRAELKKRFSPAAVDWLLASDIARLERVGAVNRLTGGRATQTEFAQTLSAEQRVAFEALKAVLDDSASGRGKTPFLLFGATGSGKTEVYLRAIQECLERGAGAIMLVPEVALTPPLLERVSARFPGLTALIHSGLTPAQLTNQWMLVKEGKLRVVLGARGALFAPVQNLRLVVIDEEHEWTYKEHENAPFYHARAVAEKLCEISDAALVLGSATPDVNSFRRAERGVYKLLTLTENPFHAQHGVKRRLKVDLVDMRDEVRQGRFGILSEHLQNAIKETLDADGIAIIFLNRLGLSSLLQCLDCGVTRQCPYCDANLVAHDAVGARPATFNCHYCGYSRRAVKKCAACGGSRVRYSIPGIQGVEREIRRLFPKAKAARWDSSTARNYRQHKAIIDAIEQGRANILLGTQMVSKGLDIHGVTLAAIVSADSVLSIPDYRSDERVFQLVTQLIGRAGRGGRGGRAVVQTFMPQHYSIRTAAEQNYRAFYGHAIDIRARHKLPPFSRFVKLIYSARSYERVQSATRDYAELLRRQMRRDGAQGAQVIGPSPVYPRRVRNVHRMQIIVKSANPELLLSRVQLPGGDWKVDVDPLSIN